MSPDKSKLLIHKARTLYRSVEESELIQFLKGNIHLNGHNLDDFLNAIPLPVNQGKSYLIIEGDTIEDAVNLITAANSRDYKLMFEETILPELIEYFPEVFTNIETGETNEKFVEVYRRLFLKNISVLSKKDSYSIAQLKENLLRRKFEKNRAGKEVYTFTHPLKAELLLPEYAPEAVHLGLLIHDDVEDSREHKALETWLAVGELTKDQETILEKMNINLNNYNQIKLLREDLFEQIFSKIQENTQEYYSLMRLKDRAELSERDLEILKNTFETKKMQDFINYELERHDFFSEIYNKHIERLYDVFLDDTKIIELGEETSNQVKKYLIGLTRRKTQSNHGYLKNILFLENKTDMFWESVMKMCDRITNTYLNPKMNPNEILKTGAKILKDAVKNTDLQLIVSQVKEQIEAHQQTEEEIGELHLEEFYLRQVAIADETNTNMDTILNHLKRTYRSLNLNLEHVNQPLEKWFQNIETRLYVDMLKGGFDTLDYESRHDEDLLSTKGIIARLDSYIRGNNIAAEIVEEKNPEAILELYTFAATLKIMSALTLGYNPFTKYSDEIIEVEKIKTMPVSRKSNLNSKYRLSTGNTTLFSSEFKTGIDLSNFFEFLGFTPQVVTLGTYEGRKYRPTGEI